MIRKYDGKSPQVHESCFVDPSAQLIGDVKLEENVSIWCNVSIRGDFGPIEIGADSNVQDNAVFHTDLESSIKIGRGVSIGHGAIIHGASIGDNSLVGMGAIVLDGAEVGKNCIIGAGALVPRFKKIPDNSLVVGLPGKVVRQVKDDEIAHNKDNAADYNHRRQIYKNQE